jgi:hypothetical protein
LLGFSNVPVFLYHLAYTGFHGKYPLLMSDFTEILIFLTDFRKMLEYKISVQSVRSVGA